LCGPQPPQQVHAELKRADVFLHTAVSEGFCNAALEAQAMQVPLVVSDADGLAENVDDGTTGFVVPRRDPHRTAERLRQLAVDPELRTRMGRAGRERVAQRFRLEDQITAFDQLYRRVLSTC
jgi:colanic acid/amylovoran biosynthesis glycosyltransferase